MSIISEVLKLSTRENVKSENSVENFPVMLKRAVCIHSSLQFVDLFMQNIMFSHGFTATPIIPNEENEISKTLSSFYRIRKEFREIFRSHHRNAVSEVAIFVGTCPVRSSYSYRVPIYICEGENSTRSSCGDTCAELNDNERRRINRDLFMHGAKDPFDKKMSNKNHRLFVFVKGTEEMVNEEIEEEEPPISSTPCHEYSFRHDNCDCEGVSAMRRTDGKWLRMIPFIVHSKY